MDHQAQFQRQIQRQIDQLERFSMPSWRLSRWMFSLTAPTRHNQLFFGAWVTFLLLGLAVIGALAWYGISPKFISGHNSEDRVFLTIIITTLSGFIWVGVVTILTERTKEVLQSHNPTPANAVQIKGLVEKARKEPALKQALERVLTEEGVGMLTQRQAEALQVIADTLFRLRTQENERRMGLDMLDDIGVVTTIQNKIRSNQLDQLLPASVPIAITKTRF